MIIGIDPGLKGGICLAWRNRDWEAYPMPITGGSLGLTQLRGILTIPGAECVRIVVIEKVHAMPKQGVTSMFNFGTGYGQVQGLCVGLGLPFILVTPQAWKRDVLAGYNWKGNKGISIVYVKHEHPHLNLRPTKRSRVDSHGMADAVCLAKYGCNLLRMAEAMGKKYGISH